MVITINIRGLFRGRIVARASGDERDAGSRQNGEKGAEKDSPGNGRFNDISQLRGGRVALLTFHLPRHRFERRCKRETGNRENEETDGGYSLLFPLFPLSFSSILLHLFGPRFVSVSHIRVTGATRAGTL